MTPTEQDKELRIAIHERMIAFRREDGNGYVDRCIEHLDSVMQLITADRKRVALEARENISKLYEKELDMHRKFMESVIVNNQLKTTVMYCNKCGDELFNLKEPTDDQPE